MAQPPPIIWRVAGPHPQRLRRPPAARLGPVWPHIEAAARLHPHRPALIGTAEQVSFGDLAANIRRVAHAVARAVPPGGGIATLLPHTPAGAIGHLGCLVSGRLTVALNPHDPPARIAAIFATARPDACLTDQVMPPPLAGAVLHLAGARADLAPANWMAPAPDEDGPAIVHFTSGSTGTPKGIALSHHAVRLRAAAAVQSWSGTEADKILAASAPYLSSGFSFLLGAIMARATTLCASLADQGAGAVLRLLLQERPGIVIASTAIARMLGRLPNAAGAFAGVRLLRMGAMGMPWQDYLAVRALLPPSAAISHTYASTEAAVVAEWQLPANPPPSAALPAGWLADGQEFALLDPAGHAAAPGEAGELVLRGRHIALGEWQDGCLVPGRMQQDPAHPTWRQFRTGDLVRLDPDGLVHVIGRADRQMSVAGMRIEPGEIEAVLRAHPEVADAAVVPGPDGRPVAFAAAPAADPATLREALIRHARAALPTPMWPAAVTVMPTLPRLAIGKTDLQALRRLAAGAAPTPVAPGGHDG